MQAGGQCPNECDQGYLLFAFNQLMEFFHWGLYNGLSFFDCPAVLLQVHFLSQLIIDL